MRLLPRSLFGRLVLVLLAGLLVAQLVTLYINAGERDQLLYRSGGMHAAQRVADLVNLLDSITPAERLKVAAVFDEPPLAVTLDRPPLPADPNASGDLQLTMLATMLRYGLGEGMPVTIVRASTSPSVSPLPQQRRRHRVPAMESMMGSMMGQPTEDGGPRASRRTAAIF